MTRIGSENSTCVQSNVDNIIPGHPSIEIVQSPTMGQHANLHPMFTDAFDESALYTDFGQTGSLQAMPHISSPGLPTTPKISRMVVKIEGNDKDMSRSMQTFSPVSGVSDIGRSSNGAVTISHGGFLHYCNGDARTNHGKRMQMIKLLSITAIPMVVLVIQNLIMLSGNFKSLNTNEEIKREILFSLQTARVVHYLQIERGVTALYLSSHKNFQVYNDMTRRYLDTDRAIHQMTKWPVVEKPEEFRTSEFFHEYVRAFRREVRSSNVTSQTAILFYKNINKIIINWLAESIQGAELSDLWHSLVGYHMLVISKEQAGVERALGVAFFNQGGFSHKDHIWYVEKRTEGETYLERSVEYEPLIKRILLKDFYGTVLEKRLRYMRDEIQTTGNATSSEKMASWWFQNMTTYIDILNVVQNSMATKIVENLNQEIASHHQGLILNFVIAALIIVVLLPMVVFFVHRVTKRIQMFASTLQYKTRDLVRERKRTKNLLYQMLPVTVAQKMLNNVIVLPEAFTSVTVLFSDIVGFTDICGRLTPLEVVAMLNVLYEAFDDKLELYDVYKVETIGDAYMVASGLPQRNGNRHSWEIANLAIELIQTVPHLSIPHTTEKYQLRVGVNTALRIQISETTKTHLDVHDTFVTEERGYIDIKGKGTMRTFWLVSRRVNEARIKTR